MLNKLLQEGATVEARTGDYAPARLTVENFLKEGKRNDDGFFWWVSPGARSSRFTWEREAITTIDNRQVAIKASTDSTRWGWGTDAGDISRALIDISVSLPGTVIKKTISLPPLSAVKNQVNAPEVTGLENIKTDLDEIIPLLAAASLA